MAATGIPPEIARAAMRTVRAKNVTSYAHPRAQLARLVRAGIIHRLADGYFTMVPPEMVGAGWKPSLEAAAGAIAATDFGPRGYVLMAMSAARIHHAIPRAIGVATVGAPRRRRAVSLSDRKAEIRFYPVELAEVEAELVNTELGQCLVTTPEQTLLDLAHYPTPKGLEHDIIDAMRALQSGCDPIELDRIAKAQRRGRALQRLQSGATA